MIGSFFFLDDTQSTCLTWKRSAWSLLGCLNMIRHKFLWRFWWYDTSYKLRWWWKGAHIYFLHMTPADRNSTESSQACNCRSTILHSLTIIWGSKGVLRVGFLMVESRIRSRLCVAGTLSALRRLVSSSKSLVFCSVYWEQSKTFRRQARPK